MNENVIVYDIMIHAGADYTIDFETFEDDDTSINVEDFSVVAQLREYPEAPDKIEFTCDADETGFHLSLSNSDTAKIPYTQGYYDMFVQNGTSLRSKFAQGKAYIIPGVTR